MHGSETGRSGAVPTAKRTVRINLGARLEFTANGLDLPSVIKELERLAIKEALRRTDGVRTAAARALHISRRMLHYKMYKLRIGPPQGNRYRWGNSRHRSRKSTRLPRR
jgi:DNA-binding NtrC family response regulator